VALPKGTELKVVQHYTGDAGVAPVTFSAYQGAPLAVEQPSAAPAPLTTRRFELGGTVKSVDAANGRLVVEHGEIPGLMGAMTMSYSVGQREDLRAIAAGDQIRADVVVSEASSHLENIKVVPRPK
jgi:Cu/Ag efflux protein CusF